MADKIFDVIVRSYDPNTMFATLVDQSENDDIVMYEMFAPSYFGGHHNPHPKAGECLRIRYGRMGRGGFDKGILECWRTKESIQ